MAKSKQARKDYWMNCCKTPSTWWFGSFFFVLAHLPLSAIGHSNNMRSSEIYQGHEYKQGGDRTRVWQTKVQVEMFAKGTRERYRKSTAN